MADKSCAFIILPDAFELGLGDAVIEWFRKRIPIQRMQMIAPFDREGVRALYPQTGDWNSGWEIKYKLLSYGPSMLVEVTSDLWQKVGQLKGCSNPWLSSPGTLRGDLDARGMVLSLIHSADNEKEGHEDMLRLREKKTTERPRMAGTGARSFFESLARIFASLGIATEPLQKIGNISRGYARLEAFERVMDTIAIELPDCIIAEWRNWNENTIVQVQKYLVAHNIKIDSWSELLLLAGIHFFHRERKKIKYYSHL